ncbi:MAG: hypothetical protein ABIF10_04515, partial [Candidatus Woesearchaeota archaeon]
MTRGQASMEFLMTYGWAILVVLAAIGALAYFGVLSPDKFLPQKCSIAPGINCAEYKVTPNSVTLALQNGMGQHIEITQIDVGTCSWVLANGTIMNGQIRTFNSGAVCDNGIVGDRYKADIKLHYYQRGFEDIQKTTDGNIVGKV